MDLIVLLVIINGSSMKTLITLITLITNKNIGGGKSIVEKDAPRPPIDGVFTPLRTSQWDSETSIGIL